MDCRACLSLYARNDDKFFQIYPLPNSFLCSVQSPATPRYFEFPFFFFLINFVDFTAKAQILCYNFVVFRFIWQMNAKFAFDKRLKFGVFALWQTKRKFGTKVASEFMEQYF